MAGSVRPARRRPGAHRVRQRRRSARCTPRSARRSTSDGRRREHRRRPGRDRCQELLKSVGLPPGLADAALDESHDAYIRADTDLAFERTGQGRRHADHHVPPRAARRGQLLRPGDLVDPARRRRAEAVGRHRDRRHHQRMAELKRSNRSKPVFDSIHLSIGCRPMSKPRRAAAPSQPSLSAHRAAQRVVARGHRRGADAHRRRASRHGHDHRRSMSTRR